MLRDMPSMHLLTVTVLQQKQPHSARQDAAAGHHGASGCMQQDIKRWVVQGCCKDIVATSVSDRSICYLTFTLFPSTFCSSRRIEWATNHMTNKCMLWVEESDSVPCIAVLM